MKSGHSYDFLLGVQTWRSWKKRVMICTLKMVFYCYYVMCSTKIARVWWMLGLKQAYFGLSDKSCSINGLVVWKDKFRNIFRHDLVYRYSKIRSWGLYRLSGANKITIKGKRRHLYLLSSCPKIILWTVCVFN